MSSSGSNKKIIGKFMRNFHFFAQPNPYFSGMSELFFLMGKLIQSLNTFYPIVFIIFVQCRGSDRQCRVRA